MNQLQHIFTQQLDGIYASGEIRDLYYWAMEEVTGWSRTQILMCKDTEISLNIQRKILEVAKDLRNFVPIQYIFGKTQFHGLILRVTKDVLIPRPETCELVDWILADKRPDLRVLDIGTGSGCIAVSLKHDRPSWQVTALDISKSALQIAKQNADENECSVTFQQCDILQNTPDGEYDIIVSNPPYICEQEKKNMERNVLDYEPNTALFVSNDDPLLFYRRIAELSKTHLSNDGFLYFEINSLYGQNTCDMLRQMNFRNIELRKDLSGLDRMIQAKKPDTT